jgi:hypothetical protein
MTGELIEATSGLLETAGGASAMPGLIVRAGGDAQKRFIEFFAAQIRNKNTLCPRRGRVLRVGR